jgi:hypothetical protein
MHNASYVAIFKFGRDTIRHLLKKEEMRTAWEQILPELSEGEQVQVEGECASNKVQQLHF